MRQIHDAPRTWNDLREVLSADDANAVAEFAAKTRGVTLTADTDPDTVEEIYEAWCQQASETP